MEYCQEIKKYERSGIIPYVVEKDQVYFLMTVYKGFDSTLNTEVVDIGDFGGSPKINENFIQTACREIDEESLGIIKLKYSDVLIKSMVINNQTDVILLTPVKLVEGIDRKFVEVIFDCLKTVRRSLKLTLMNVSSENLQNMEGFSEETNYNPEEVESIKWLTREEFISILTRKDPRHFYYRVHNLLKNVFDSLTFR